MTTPAEGAPTNGRAVTAWLKDFTAHPLTLVVARLALLGALAVIGYGYGRIETTLRSDSEQSVRLARMDGVILAQGAEHKAIFAALEQMARTSSEEAVRQATLRADFATVQVTQGDVLRRLDAMDRFGTTALALRVTEILRRLDVIERRLEGFRPGFPSTGALHLLPPDAPPLTVDGSASMAGRRP